MSLNVTLSTAEFELGGRIVSCDRLKERNSETEWEREAAFGSDPSSLIGISVEYDTCLNIHRRFQLVYSSDNVCGRIDRQAAGLRFKRSPPPRIRMDMIFLSPSFLFIYFFYPIAVYIVLNFITSLGKKTDIPFYSTVHKFQIIFPCSSLSLSLSLSFCSLFAVHDENDYVFYSVFAFYARGEREGKRNHFSRIANCTVH